MKPLPKAQRQPSLEPTTVRPSATHTPRRWAWLASLCAMLVIAGGVWWWSARAAPQPPTTTAPAAVPLPTITDLLKMTDAELATYDLARMNLACAVGLHGSEKLDVAACLHQLDRWAERVAIETEHNFDQFVWKPRDFNNSEGYFRMLMLVTVLQQDLGVHYNLARANTPDFSNAQDVFIHGMIDNDNGGTCASMPVLYTAISRRLHYPVFLVKAKEHLFCRWEGAWRSTPPDRFNVEGSGTGMNSFPDEYYRTWPHPMSAAEVQRGEYLRSLDPAATLALCLAERAYVLEDNHDHTSACAMYAEAAKRDKMDAMYPQLAARMALRARTGILPIFPAAFPGEPEPLAGLPPRSRRSPVAIPMPGVAPQPWQPPVIPQPWHPPQAGLINEPFPSLPRPDGRLE